jgi:hypothetical protein
MVKAELEMGLISKVDALRTLHPEIESDEEAIERLIRVERFNQILNTPTVGEQQPIGD